MLLFLALNAAAAPPCNPINSDLFIRGEHFWVRWDAEVGDEEEAEQVLQWAEEARESYIDLGWPITDQTIIIGIEQSPQAGGLCSTAECPDGTVVPVITLFATGPSQSGENTVKHEVVHAFEYYHMGSYIDAITSWAWWVEGTASWLVIHGDNDLGKWRSTILDYVDEPWIGLHQTPLAYLPGSSTNGFMYGTALIAKYIEDEYGMETMQKMWEYGGTQTGTPVYLPDAIEAADLEWEPFWQDFMAMMTVMDMEGGDEMYANSFKETKVGSLPADGAPKVKRMPQGLGLSIVHFKSKSGQEARSLDVSFEGDPEVEWMAVLVRTKNTGPGGKVKEVVPFELKDGKGEASLDAFDGTREGYLVVSPMGMSLEGHDYSWSASLGGGPKVGAEEEGGCGCSSTPLGVGWVGLLGLLSLVRRRQR